MRTILTSTLIAVSLSTLMPVAGHAGWEEGVAAFQAGDYATATREFQALVDSRTDCAACYQMLGQALLKTKKPQEAAIQLRKGYDLEPQNNGIRLPLALAYLESKRYDDAVKLLQTIDPSALSKKQQTAYHQYQAVALDRSGRSDQVMASLKAAAQASPSDAEAQYRYGQSCLAERESCAIPVLEKAVQLDPRDPDKKRSLLKAHLLQGRSARGSAKDSAYGSAARVAEQLVAVSASGENLLLLGEAQLGAKQYSAAASTFERARGAGANTWLTDYYLGQAQTATKSYSAAEASLKTALGKTSNSKDENLVWGQLGFVYEKEKKLDQAKEAYRRIGDSAAVARIEENQRIAEENEAADEFNQQVDEIKQQQEELKRQMDN
ncbi:MAG: tetratricopeptide repeat protein, partial [Thermoanaerobaculia bacterium]|nr:tetratricopeptide repeat protein [Thermoanaerobaculia bacterium]